MKTKLLAFLSILSFGASCAVAGAAKTAGNYEIMFDALDAAGGAPFVSGNYALYQSVGQPAGAETSSVNTYVLQGGFLGGVDETPPTVSFSSPAAASTQSGAVSVAGTAFDENGAQWTLYYGPGASPAAWKQIASGAANATAASLATWNASSLSGPYTLKIVAVDGRGNTAEGTVTFSVANTVTISGTIPKLKWMMISVPALPSVSDPAAIFGAGEYKVYRMDNSAADDPYLGKYRYPASLGAGDGFWIKAYYNDLNYSYAGSLVDSTNDFAVALKTGWNQIGAPFNRDFPWGQVRVRDGADELTLAAAAANGLISSTLYSYDSAAKSWTQNDTSAQMTPETGYAVRAYKDVSLLFGPGAGMPGGLARVVRPAFDYRVKLSAAAKETADLDNYFGVAGLADAEYDMFDAEEPPKTLEEKYVSLYFPREGWSRNAGQYANDVRAAAKTAGDTETWAFDVETNETGETITLTWDSSKLPTNLYSFTLVNLDTGEQVNMATHNSYTYMAADGDISTAHFKIEVIKLESAGRVVKTFTLAPGWNLISVPVEPEITSALAQLGDDLPLLDVYQLYDGEYYAAENADIQAGLGYWVYVADNTEIDIEGVPVASEVRVPLKPGWNLIGNPFDGDLTWGDNIKIETAGITRTLSEAIAAGLIDGKVYEREGDGYTALNSGATLQPWRGYFVTAREDCTLVLGR